LKTKAFKTKAFKRSGHAAHWLSDGDLWATGASMKDRVPVVPSRVAFRFGDDPIPGTGIHYSSWHTLFLIVAEMIQYFLHSNINAAIRQVIDIQRYCAANV
jgi:hypothetical protein